MENEEHKLKDVWRLWYAPRGKRSKYQADKYEHNLKMLGEIHTVEDFFSFYCFMNRPSDIDIDNKLMLFRKGCKPLWECWPDGGTWILMLKKKELEELNKFWESLLVACLGEQFGTCMIGIVMSKRSKRNLLEIWISNRNEETSKYLIGEKLRIVLGLSDNLTFYFKDHETSMKAGSTLRGRQSFTFVTTPYETPLQTPNQPPVKVEKKEEKEELDNFKL